jgi:hypothetical protein
MKDTFTHGDYPQVETKERNRTCDTEEEDNEKREREAKER